MSEKCVHEWYYRIVDIVSWQFFCIRCGEKLSMDKFSNHASDLEKNADALNARIAELEAAVKGHDPFEEFPPKERGFECSVMVLGKFEYEEEFTTFTNWDLCVYWFDEERWHPLNGYLKGDDIVRWYALPPEVQE